MLITIEQARETKKKELNTWFRCMVQQYADSQGWDLDRPDDLDKLNVELDKLSRSMWK